MSLPAILLDTDDAVEPLAAYGRDVGRGFQAKDDLIDLPSPSGRLGNQRRSDIVENKVTLVSAHAREDGVDGLAEADAAATRVESDVEASLAEFEPGGSIKDAR